MKKLKLFTFVVICTIIIASCFGILHDQITYSISPEYYTKFKFIQFELVDEGMTLQAGQRSAAIVVGIMATWWMGLFIGFIYAGILLFFKEQKNIYRIYFQAVVLTFIITILASIFGYFYAKIHLLETGVDWFIPEGVIDVNSFICAGSIHNASYIGGVTGCMAGTLYLLIKKKTEQPPWPENKKD